MSRSRLFLVLALLIIRSFNLAHPQRPAAVTENPPALIGSVIGSVYDEVTRLPIRFAEINLVPVPSKTEAPPAGNQPDAPQQRKRVVSRITGTSGIDGSFRLNVPPGDYLVAALKSGYIHPAATPAMDFSLSEDQLKKIIASQPQVHVGAGETASASLTLHRGAVISGRIQFADGSPAIDAPVACDLIDSVQRMESALRPENRGKVASPLQEALRSLAISQQDLPKFTTDDEGRYRIFGLLPGKYLVASAVVMDHRPGEVAMSDGSNPTPRAWHTCIPK